MKKVGIITGLVLAPSLAFADVNNLLDLITQLKRLINAMIPLLFGIALLAFMWGVIMYIWQGNNANKIKEARNFIIFSIVGIAVMLSVWSLALFLKNSFFPSAPATYNPGNGSVSGGGGGSSSGGGGGGTISCAGNQVPTKNGSCIDLADPACPAYAADPSTCNG